MGINALLACKQKTVDNFIFGRQLFKKKKYQNWKGGVLFLLVDSEHLLDNADIFRIRLIVMETVFQEE